jgi:hypothetical protein
VSGGKGGGCEQRSNKSFLHEKSFQNTIWIKQNIFNDVMIAGIDFSSRKT